MPSHNSKLARVSCLKAMGVFCILDVEVQVLLIVCMVAIHNRTHLDKLPRVDLPVLLRRAIGGYMFICGSILLR